MRGSKLDEPSAFYRYFSIVAVQGRTTGPMFIDFRALQALIAS